MSVVKVLNKINERNEVNLSSEEIKLSSVKELNQYISILKANIKESEKEGNKYIKAEGELLKAWSKLNAHRNVIYSNAVSSAPKVISDFEKKIKELGLNPSSVSEVKELKKLIGEVKEYIKLFDGVSKPKEQL